MDWRLIQSHFPLFLVSLTNLKVNSTQEEAASRGNFSEVLLTSICWRSSGEVKVLLKILYGQEKIEMLGAIALIPFTSEIAPDNSWVY